MALAGVALAASQIPLERPARLILPAKEIIQVKRSLLPAPAIVRARDIAELPELAMPFQPGFRKPHGYSANAVHFDGTNDYLTRGADLTGIADTKLVTGSVWINPAVDAASLAVIRGDAAGPSSRFMVIRDDTAPTNGARIFGRNSSGTTILDIRSSAGVAEAADGWVNILFSLDLADTAKRHLYIDDVSDLATVTAYTNDTMDLTLADWAVGANTGGAAKFNGDMADLLLWDGVYLDLSVEANRRLFIDASLKPVDPDAASGVVATLGTPIVRLTNPTATWHTNAGDGGGFTENGALTDAATSPSD